MTTMHNGPSAVCARPRPTFTASSEHLFQVLNMLIMPNSKTWTLLARLAADMLNHAGHAISMDLSQNASRTLLLGELTSRSGAKRSAQSPAPGR